MAARREVSTVRVRGQGGLQHAQGLRFVIDDEYPSLPPGIMRSDHTSSPAGWTQLLQVAQNLIRGQLAAAE